MPVRSIRATQTSLNAPAGLTCETRPALPFFIEVEHSQNPKHGQPVPGDVFLSRKVKQESRTVSVLADGLGSGVKANVLATLTSTMALEFVSRNTDIRQTARIIMDILPVCSERQIGYSTFSIVDIERHGDVRIIEHENPPVIFLRNGRPHQLEKTSVEIPVGVGNVQQQRLVEFSSAQARPGDRIIFFSDGVTQSGLGRPEFPRGWGGAAVAEFALRLIGGNPRISARELARRIVDLATANDEGKTRDDITCGVVYFRRPRKLLLVTGPPYAKERDRLMAETFEAFEGHKLVCGGTTASIICRELKRRIEVNVDELDSSVPPTSNMEGATLVTEGTLTLSTVVKLLEDKVNPEGLKRNGAVRILEYLLNSDEIHFLVGTRINEAHQDPNTPVELDLRRTLMKRIAHILEHTHLKETSLQFI